MSIIIQNVLKIAEIRVDYISKALQVELIGKSEYLDNVRYPREHIFRPSYLLVVENFSPECRTELQVLAGIIEAADCSHLRIVN